VILDQTAGIWLRSMILMMGGSYVGGSFPNIFHDPHDYQLDSICPVLDGFDLLATTPTGSGKTGYLIMLMLIVREISSDGKLAIGKRKFPKDPAMIVVCLTKALEDDMASQMQKAGLTAIVINSDTIDAARRVGRHL